MKKGFTIIELMIATAFFSMLLFIIVLGFVQINRSYTRGITVKNTQSAARVIFDDIINTLRNTKAGNFTFSSSPDFRLCAGDIRYGWNQYWIDQFTSENTAEGNVFSLLKSYDGASCSNDFSEDESISPIQENLVVQYLGIEPVAGSSTTYRLEMVVSTRESVEGEDLEAYGQNALCKVGIGDQYCDVVNLNTVVTMRN